jgi:hypothetical protein
LRPAFVKNYFQAASSLAVWFLALKRLNSSEFSWKLPILGKQQGPELPPYALIKNSNLAGK